MSLRPQVHSTRRNLLNFFRFYGNKDAGNTYGNKRYKTNKLEEEIETDNNQTSFDAAQSAVK